MAAQSLGLAELRGVLPKSFLGCSRNATAHCTEINVTANTEAVEVEVSYQLPLYVLGPAVGSTILQLRGASSRRLEAGYVANETSEIFNGAIPGVR
jgi:hypothetical protein